MKPLIIFLAALPLCAQVSITLTPTTATLTAGQSASFQAVISGSGNAGSSSAISPAVGTLVVLAQQGAGDRVTYTAPAVIAGQQTVIITSTAHADATKTAAATITLLPSMPPITATDPVLVALQSAATSSGSTLYADLDGCLLNNSTCKLLAVVYSCFPPNQWQANTAYLFGSLVSDGLGNVFKLIAIAQGTTNSGTVPIWIDAMGAITQNGGYSWTMVFQAGATYMCGDAAITSPSTIVSSIASAQ
jgi:hypothetical protein